MIFEQLSLEFWLAGKALPWNKTSNPVTRDYVILDSPVPGRPRTPYDRGPQYFNLKG